MTLDALDERLLDLAQADFPLTARSFEDLGRSLGIDGEACLERARRLRRDGYIRFFGPVVNTRSLGFHSALCAFRTPPERLEAAAEIVSGHPGVSHNYQREDVFNLWFTLAVPPHLDLQRDFEILKRRARPESALLLPALRTFKIRMVLQLGGPETSTPEATRGHGVGGTQSDKHGAGSGGSTTTANLSETESEILSRAESGLELVAAPFEPVARELGLDVNKVLETLRSLMRRGVVRRFGVLLHHRKAGFAHNEMTAWSAPADQVVAWGERLAAEPRVSHCYERPAHAEWPFNIYAMIHGRDADETARLVEILRADLGAEPPRRLVSVREFKKVRLSYFTKAYDNWNREES
jgi:DNA-binding Lrp family transcriptional regulator